MEQFLKENAGGELKILVVEDSGLSFALTQALIERLAGNSPDRASDGTVAVEMVQSGDYDLVIMDLLMPEMDGLEATRQIRRLLPAWKQPYIAGLSGATSTSDVMACEAAGMNQFLAKPMRLAKLSELLDLVGRKVCDKLAFEATEELEVSIA